jgi:hypothetical protein
MPDCIVLFSYLSQSGTELTGQSGIPGVSTAVVSIALVSIEVVSIAVVSTAVISIAEPHNFMRLLCWACLQLLPFKIPCFRQFFPSRSRSNGMWLLLRRLLPQPWCNMDRIKIVHGTVIRIQIIRQCCSTLLQVNIFNTNKSQLVWSGNLFLLISDVLLFRAIFYMLMIRVGRRGRNLNSIILLEPEPYHSVSLVTLPYVQHINISRNKNCWWGKALQKFN